MAITDHDNSNNNNNSSNHNLVINTTIIINKNKSLDEEMKFYVFEAPVTEI